MIFSEGFRELVKAYVRSRLQPTEENYFKFYTATSSLGIWKVEEVNKVFSIFFREKVGTNRLIGLMDPAINPRKCDPSYNPGHQNDKNHELWHTDSKNDIYVQHAHVIKKNNKGEITRSTPADIKCMLKNVAEYQQANEVCQDGKTNCFLSQEDQSNLARDYEEYYNDPQAYFEQKKAPQIEEITNQLLGKMQELVKESACIFFHSFITTLLENYLKPYLISEQYWSNSSAACFIGLTKSGMTALFSQSYLSTAIDIVARNTIQPNLVKLGVDEKLCERIVCGFLSTIVATQEPLSLVMFAFKGNVAWNGQKAAYMLIRSLPKLKEEPKERQINVKESVITHEESHVRRRRS